MPPKKKDEGPKERPILGRFKNNLKMGIVGLPNVGKSTLFNVLTKIGVPAENFPFCTIEPNQARVNVPDDRFTWLCGVYKPKSQVPAFLDICDIAGLVRGAAKGEGLGNAFLSHISAVDGIFHVCRAFEDPDVTHVEDRIDPVADLDIIHAELRAKDVERLDTIIADFNKTRAALKKDEQEELATAKKVRAWCCGEPEGGSASEGGAAGDGDVGTPAGGRDVRLGEWSAREVEILNTWQLLTAKPVVYLVNVSEKDYARKKNKFLPKIFEWVQAHGGDPIIPFSGAFEERLLDMPDDERAKTIEEVGAPSALPKIITTGFKSIHLIYFFTAGADEVKCWQIRRGTKAPGAAGTIHTDFERGFICAEQFSWDDLKELGTEQAVKSAGRCRQQGKEYVVLDGDVLFFKFNVTSSGKK